MRRYARQVEPRRDPPPAPQPARRKAPPEKPAPEPARSTAAQSEPAAAEPAPARAVLTRAAVLVRHDLEEGLLEVRVDGRRAALRRIGANGAAALPGQPVSALLEVEPGEHRIEVRLLSATRRVDASAKWQGTWSEGGFRAREWQLVAEGPGGRLVDRTSP